MTRAHTDDSSLCSALLKAALVIGSLLAVAGTATADTAVIDQRAPGYPPKALAYGVDAQVVALMRADEGGEVTEVRLEEVTAPGWGFSQSVRQALSRWRFEPARVDGEPAPRVYRRTVTFKANRPRQLARMYPVRSAEAFAAVKEVVEALGLPTKVVSGDNQIIITPDMPLSKAPEGFPSVEDVGSADWRFVQVHLFIPPEAEPARVYCNARLSRTAGEYVSAAVYSEGTVEAWLLDRIDRRLDHRGRVVPANPSRREAVAVELAKGLPVDPSRPIAEVVTREDDAFDEIEPPTPIPATQVPAIDPTDPRPRSETRAVQLEAVVHDDGSVAVASVLSFPRGESEQLASAAAQAARLWRFRPARLDGRPVSVVTRLTLSFPKRSR